MKKILTILMAVVLITGCSSVSSNQSQSNPSQSSEPQSVVSTDLKILAPSGAPALSLLGLLVNPDYDITIVEGSDVLQASFVNPEPEYDVIVAPTNLGVKLALTGKSNYRLAAIITWGNLYVLAENAEALTAEDAVFAAFGEQAVPGLVFETIKDQLKVTDVTYYNAVTEAQAALLSDHATAALIAEPAATATLAKANEAGKVLTVVADVQELWKTKTGSAGYPQASIFVLETDENKAAMDELLLQIETSMANYQSYIDNGSSQMIVDDIDVVGAERLGVPSSQIVAKSYSKMGLNYRLASECEKELIDFLSLFDIDYDSSIAVR